MAMDPKTGEVLALASYPRFDPNDFISSAFSDHKSGQQARVLRWLENEAYIGEIWDGKHPLERERFDPQKNRFYEESLYLSWDRYLEAILPKEGSLHLSLQRIQNIKNVYRFELALQRLLAISCQEDLQVLLAALYTGKSHAPFKKGPPAEKIEEAKAFFRKEDLELFEEKKILDRYLEAIRYQDDKLLFIDLCRVLIDRESFSPDLVEQIGEQTLNDYFALNQCATRICHFLYRQAQQRFHTIDFQKWRDAHFKDFLKGKREEEKKKKTYSRPYIEYLEQIEKKLF
ncbi:MAG: hypothetical protein HYZ48_01015, partial [Chlamydiales bacterium]|nr:hypothetical protein [Chlamydiales bacterium]